jgi:ribonuclease HI
MDNRNLGQYKWDIRIDSAKIIGQELGAYGWYASCEKGSAEGCGTADLASYEHGTLLALVRALSWCYDSGIKQVRIFADKSFIDNVTLVEHGLRGKQPATLKLLDRVRAAEGYVHWDFVALSPDDGYHTKYMLPMLMRELKRAMCESEEDIA